MRIIILQIQFKLDKYSNNIVLTEKRTNTVSP